MKHVIHIFGASGSGTSSLGRVLCRELGYSFMDTDDYYWLPTDPKYTQKRPPSERVELMKRGILAAVNVVISGSLSGWGDELTELFTLAVRLKADTALRINRLKRRERETFGSRIDAGGDMHRNHMDFLDWAAAYDQGGPDMRSKTRHDQWQKLLKCRLLTLDGGNDLLYNAALVKNAL